MASGEPVVLHNLCFLEKHLCNLTVHNLGLPAGRRGCRSMAREAFGGLPDTPVTLQTLGDIRMGSPELPNTPNRPEPFRNHHIQKFYGQVNSQDYFCEADHVSRILKCKSLRCNFQENCVL